MFVFIHSSFLVLSREKIMVIFILGLLPLRPSFWFLHGVYIYSYIQMRLSHTHAVGRGARDARRAKHANCFYPTRMGAARQPHAERAVTAARSAMAAASAPNANSLVRITRQEVVAPITGIWFQACWNTRRAAGALAMLSQCSW